MRISLYRGKRDLNNIITDIDQKVYYRFTSGKVYYTERYKGELGVLNFSFNFKTLKPFTFKEFMRDYKRMKKELNIIGILE
jgi:hypothetical protein